MFILINYGTFHYAHFSLGRAESMVLKYPEAKQG